MAKETKELQIQLAREERELQIKIAQLQSDINIFLSLSLAHFALIGGLLVAGYQFFTDGFTTNNMIKIAIGLALFGISVPSIIRSQQNLNKVKLSRQKLHSLK